jgi:Transposase zinc-binding domain
VSRPTVEVADIFRAQGKNFIDRHRTTFRFQQLKVMRAIMHCRTAALGGHVDVCPRCGDRAISYNSCRNRHCPKCQSQARQRWIAARKQELLATRYFHVVFTLPHELHALVLQNESELYNLLFRTVAETLLEIRTRFEAPWSGDWLLWHPPHVGTELAVPSPHPLCYSRRRNCTGSCTLDSSAISILLTWESPRKGVPWKVRRGTASGFSEGGDSP